MLFVFAVAKLVVGMATVPLKASMTIWITGSKVAVETVKNSIPEDGKRANAHRRLCHKIC